MIAIMDCNLLKEKVALSNMTQQEIGKAIGASAKYVRKMCTEYVNIRITLYERICRYFGLDWYELLGMPKPDNAFATMHTDTLQNKKAVLDHVQFDAMRKANGFTQEKLAQELGISEEHAQGLCYKDTNVALVLYAKICALFNMQLGSMLTYVDCA